MVKKYYFWGDGEILFDSTKTVRELISCAFEKFGYYEPMGKDIVTVFQAHHSADTTGWFTTDTSRTCEEEIENCEELFFAYHLPEVFYFAEGGWGHHMKSLGNHPAIHNPVALHIRAEEFDHTVVINGTYTFEAVVKYMQRGGYAPDDATRVVIRAINPYREPYSISLTDPIIKAPLTQFEAALPDSVTIITIQ